jgi:hypothetical protein
MNRHALAATSGIVLLLPAAILVSGGLLSFEVPGALVHPVFVMGGLLLALLVNTTPLVRIRFTSAGGEIVSTVAVRVRGAAGNLLVLAAGWLLLATIAVYLFLENFEPRIIG